MNTPKGCKTPKRDREEYRLTSADLTFMIKAAESISNMLSYYCNMPENHTGCVYVEGDSNCAKFDHLCNLVEGIKDDLWSTEWR